MNLSAAFSPETRELPFASYGEYTDYLFSCVDLQLSAYIRNLMGLFAREDGSFRTWPILRPAPGARTCRKSKPDRNRRKTTG